MSYWIPAAILASYVVFWFAMTETIGPPNMRLGKKLRNAVTKRPSSTASGQGIGSCE
jgi:hypothetical protein